MKKTAGRATRRQGELFDAIQGALPLTPGVAFYNWLIVQYEREDKVGELARELRKRRVRPPESESVTDPYTFRQWFMICRCSCILADHIEAAWLEWEGGEKRRAVP